jgi:pimeloyl-ACP methyl ester carboxylesterase
MSVTVIVASDMKAPTPITRRRALQQARGLAELGRLTIRAPHLLRERRGEGVPVMVVPGFGTGDGSTLLLRWYLRALGYRVHGWGLGRNRGDVPELIPMVAERTLRIAQESSGQVRLVGWSLGGYLAREVAREHPEAVARVVTFGAPVIGGPKYTAVADFYLRRGVDLDAIEAAVAARERVPIRVPVTAIYSRSDGIVSWQACLDHSNPNVEHIEVDTTHLGLGLSPDVYRIVARRLAPPADELPEAAA